MLCQLVYGCAIAIIAFKLVLIGEYSVSLSSEVQEPHPQPPPRKRGACSDVPHVIRTCYKGTPKNKLSQIDG